DRARASSTAVPSTALRNGTGPRSVTSAPDVRPRSGGGLRPNPRPEGTTPYGGCPPPRAQVGRPSTGTTCAQRAPDPGRRLSHSLLQQLRDALRTRPTVGVAGLPEQRRRHAHEPLVALEPRLDQLLLPRNTGVHHRRRRPRVALKEVV